MLEPRTQISVLVLALFACSAASATGEDAVWGEPVVELTLAGPDIVSHRAFVGAVEASAETWMAVDGAPIVGVFSERGEVAEVALDGVNAVFFSEEWTGHPSQLALTFTHVSDDEILEMDMAINAEHHIFTTRPDLDWNAFDLQNLLTHELGHGLGLDHLQEQEASMFQSIEVGETLKRDLEDTDIATLNQLYEDVGFESGGCAATGAPPLFLGIFLLFLAALRVRPTRVLVRAKGDR